MLAGINTMEWFPIFKAVLAKWIFTAAEKHDIFKAFCLDKYQIDE